MSSCLSQLFSWYMTSDGKFKLDLLVGTIPSFLTVCWCVASCGNFRGNPFKGIILVIIALFFFIFGYDEDSCQSMGEAKDVCLSVPQAVCHEGEETYLMLLSLCNTGGNTNVMSQGMELRGWEKWQHRSTFDVGRNWLLELCSQILLWLKWALLFCIFPTWYSADLCALFILRQFESSVVVQHT